MSGPARSGLATRARRHDAGVLAPALTLLVIAGCASPEARVAPDSPPEPQADLVPEVEVEILRPITMTPDAFLPESDALLTDVEISDDGLVFVYSAAPTRTPAIGDVVSGVIDDGYLRRITGVVGTTELPGGGMRLEVTTDHAELVELIGDGHFRARFRPRDGDTFRPVDMEGVASEALTTGWSLLTYLGASDFYCAGGSSGLSLRPAFDLDITLDVDMNIEWSRRAVVRPVGELESAHYILSGPLEIGGTISTNGVPAISCGWDCTHRATNLCFLPALRWRSQFLVGPVPMVLSHSLSPHYFVELRGRVERGSATATFMGRISGRMGAEYTRETGWVPVWREPAREGEGSLGLDEGAALTMQAVTTAGIGYGVKVYDTVGPQIRPQLVHRSTFRTPDRCDWTLETSLGMDLQLRVSLDVPFFDRTIANFNATQSIAEGPLGIVEGAFPWCRNGADAGSPPASGECDRATDCLSCNMIAGCGHCAATGRCIPDSERTLCDGAQWRDSPSECEVCSGHADCGSCVRDAFCGWCASSGACLTAASGGGAPIACPDWSYGSTNRCL